MELDLQVSPEEMMSIGRWSCAAKVGLLSLRVVPQQQCNGHCPFSCDSAQARQLKQQLRSALVAGQWRGDTALTFPLFCRRSTPGLSGLFRRVSAIEPSLFRSPPPPPSTPVPPLPLPPATPVPVPNKPPRFCGRKAKWSYLLFVYLVLFFMHQSNV